ncbi:transposase [Alkaliphilus hydrothermalis]|uniref:REP element-mobilizing transposase RayT n=1 Tax=Alkaliphilus hydrothermalis TaxID=1482730 RepID=A0ABS2NQ50_9FIRM|nr:transposase [Alkaliphilus hydrothermalis]MBM7615041.1 REP element-mobilizing transposase RayT [Alkaliphilus hydrothermalis]
MPRKPREKSKTGIYHIILRGINRQNIFEDEEDQLEFLKTLRKYKVLCGYQMYGYCLMTNHVHLLIKEIDESISNSIKRICGSYAYWYNNKYDRVGHLFQERFKSEVVKDDQYLLTVLRYIHQNPSKAGLIKNIEEYDWSSYKEFIGDSQVVDIDLVLSLFSKDKDDAIHMFKEYTEQKNQDICLELQEKIQVEDEVVISYLRELGVICISQLQQLEKVQRNEVIKKLKSINGITIRQLSRITGISKSVIGRL